MRIFITGNLGFIGTHLAELLIERGYTVIGFDKEQESGSEKYECIHGNILDVELLNKSTKVNIDLIIHLAAISGVHELYDVIYFNWNSWNWKNNYSKNHCKRIKLHWN